MSRTTPASLPLGSLDMPWMGRCEENPARVGDGGASIVFENLLSVGRWFVVRRLDLELDGRQLQHEPADLSSEPREVSFGVPALAPGVHRIAVRVVVQARAFGLLAYIYIVAYHFHLLGAFDFVVDARVPPRIRVVAFERGGVVTPPEERPHLSCAARTRP